MDADSSIQQLFNKTPSKLTPKKRMTPSKFGSANKLRTFNSPSFHFKPPVFEFPKVEEPETSVLDDEISQNYFNRKNLGEVLASYNPDLMDLDSAENTKFLKFEIVEDKLTEQYRYMNPKIGEVSEALEYQNQLILEKIEGVKQEFKLVDPNAISQEIVTTIGRICFDDELTNGEEVQMTDDTVMIEPFQSMGNGERVHLDLSYLKSYCLTPGQIVYCEGQNFNGTKFTVNKFLPIPELKFEDSNSQGSIDQTSVWVSSGPYTLESNLKYEPFQTLINQLESNCPNSMIIMGPFVSENHPLIVKGDTTSTPQELFQNYIGQPLNSLASKYPKTQFFIVPSPDDLIQNYLTLPQPAFQSKLSLRILEPNVHLLSNPAELKLDDKLFSFANFETVIPLVKSQFKKEIKSNGIEEGLELILNQQNLYPLFPVYLDNIQIHYPLYHQLNLTNKPNFIITNSKLAPFIKNIKGTIFINTGSYSKFNQGGSLCKISLHPSIKEESGSELDWSKNVKVEIVKS